MMHRVVENKDDLGDQDDCDQEDRDAAATTATSTATTSPPPTTTTTTTMAAPSSLADATAVRLLKYACTLSATMVVVPLQTTLTTPTLTPHRIRRTWTTTHQACFLYELYESYRAHAHSKFLLVGDPVVATEQRQRTPPLALVGHRTDGGGGMCPVIVLLFLLLALLRLLILLRLLPPPPVTAPSLVLGIPVERVVHAGRRGSEQRHAAGYARSVVRGIISSHLPSPSAPVYLPAGCKIWFLDGRDEDDEDDSAEDDDGGGVAEEDRSIFRATVRGWRADRSAVETQRVHARQLHALLGRLHDSNQRLPRSHQRAPNGFRVGYLPLHSLSPSALPPSPSPS